MKSHRLLILAVLLVVQESWGDCGCKGKSDPENFFWSDYKYTGKPPCLQWPLVRKYVHAIPFPWGQIQYYRRHFEMVLNGYRYVMEYGPQKGVEKILANYQQEFRYGIGKKVAEFLPLLAENLKPTLEENIDNLALVFAKWLKETLVEPVYVSGYSPARRYSFCGFDGLSYGSACKECRKMLQKNGRQNFWNEDQEHILKKFNRKYASKRDLAEVFNKVFEVVDHLTRCADEGGNSSKPNTGLWQCLAKVLEDDLRYIIPRRVWKQSIQPFQAEIYQSLANATVSLDKLISDGLVCYIVDEDSDPQWKEQSLAEFAARLYNGIGNNQPFREIFTALGQFLPEEKEDGGEDGSGYQEPGPYLLEELVQRYPDHAKSVLVFLNSTFPAGKRKSIGDSTAVLVGKLVNVLRGIPILADINAYFSRGCSYYSVFKQGHMPELEMYAESQLNRVIHDEYWRKALGKYYAMRLRQNIPFNKNALGKLLWSDKRSFIEAKLNELYAFLEDPYPTLDRIISKDWLEEKLGYLIQALFPKDDTGEIEKWTSEKAELLKQSLDFKQVFETITLVHIRFTLF